jgi:hypothetical protein
MIMDWHAFDHWKTDAAALLFAAVSLLSDNHVLTFFSVLLVLLRIAREAHYWYRKWFPAKEKA